MQKPPKNNDTPRRSKTKENANQQTLNIDAGTIVLIISVLILLPLLLTGFISH